MAISSRYCRSERAIVKTVRTSVLSLRGAKRRGNLGKALPFGTSHRKDGTHLRFVIARRPEADVAISGRHCRSERATVKPACTPDLSLRGAKRRGNLAVLARITEKLRRIRPPERQSRYETVLCLPFDQQRKYCPVHRHDKRPAKKIVRTPRRPCRELYKAISCS